MLQTKNTQRKTKVMAYREKQLLLSKKSALTTFWNKLFLIIYEAIYLMWKRKIRVYAVTSEVWAS
jgi:uncharacterized membrane protein